MRMSTKGEDVNKEDTKDKKSVLERLNNLMLDTSRIGIRIANTSIIFENVVTQTRTNPITNEEVKKFLTYFDIKYGYLNHWDTSDCYCEWDEFFKKTSAFISEIDTPEKAALKLKNLPYKTDLERQLGSVGFPDCIVHMLLNLVPDTSKFSPSDPILEFIYDHGKVGLFLELRKKGYKPTQKDAQKMSENLAKLEGIVKQAGGRRGRGNARRQQQILDFYSQLKEFYFELQSIIAIPEAPPAPFPTWIEPEQNTSERKTNRENVNKPFKSVDDFILALKKYYDHPGIQSLCNQLNILKIDLDSLSENQKKLLEEACLVANKGTCIDEALYVSKRLSEGGTPKEIDSEIQKLREEMAVFHGLIQGPCQKMVGPDKMLEMVFDHYGLKQPDQKEKQKFSFSDSSGAEFVKLLSQNPGKSFLLNLVEANGMESHVIAFSVDKTGKFISAYDVEWHDKIPIESIWEMLQMYRVESQKNYVDIEVDQINLREKPKFKM